MSSAYIVNGIGRCGTTLLYTFLLQHYTDRGFIKDLRTLAPKVNSVYKTHSLQPLRSNVENVKMLFMVGNVYNSVLSYKNKIWSKQAMIHLSAEQNFTKDHMKEDIFGFGRYFKNWYKPIGCPLMFIKYEDLYDNLQEVLDFCDIGDKINEFPKFRERSTDWRKLPKEDIDKLIEIYGKDQEFIDSIPSIKIFN